MHIPIPTGDWPVLGSFAAAAMLAFAALRNASSAAARPLRALLLAALVLTVHAWLYLPFTVDDAFITFRFSRNWAEGLGPVYQSGPRVEGYTSFAWMGLLALARRVGLDLPAASKVLGLACAVWTLIATRRLALRLLPERRSADLAPLLLAVQPLFAAWVFAGMDAMLFAAVLTAASAALADPAEPDRALPRAALLFGFAVWVRPEGALFAGCALLALLSARPGGRRSWGFAARWLTVLLVVALPFWLWRWHYYGAFFPNTFYAKTGVSPARLYRGLSALLDFGRYWGVLPLLLVALAAARLPSSRPLGRYLAVALSAFALYFVWVGGDVLHLRFFVHVLPLLMVLVAAGLDLAVTALASGGPWTAGARRAVVLAGVLIWTGLAWREDGRALEARDRFGPAYVVGNSRNVSRAHAPLGRWLRANAPAGASVAAWDIGALGYESRLPVVDMLGLTDASIARLWHRRAPYSELVRAFEAIEPPLIVTYAGPGELRLGWLEEGREWVEGSYRVHSYWPDSPTTGLALLTRSDLRLPPRP